MIEYHVEYHFNTSPVQRFDHVPKLVNGPEWILPRAIRLMRREERNGRVAPIVTQPARRILRIELKNRKQFDCCDTKLFEVRNLLNQTLRRCPASFPLMPELG